MEDGRERKGRRGGGRGEEGEKKGRREEREKEGKKGGREKEGKEKERERERWIERVR